MPARADDPDQGVTPKRETSDRHEERGIGWERSCRSADGSLVIAEQAVLDWLMQKGDGP